MVVSRSSKVIEGRMRELAGARVEPEASQAERSRRLFDGPDRSQVRQDN
jgi:hypothetical protein